MREQLEIFQQEEKKIMQYEEANVHQRINFKSHMEDHCYLNSLINFAILEADMDIFMETESFYNQQKWQAR